VTDDLDTNEMELDVHRGEVLYGLAGTYNTLERTLVECAQNAIDADATIVMIAIDQKASLVTVADNGTGIDREKFRLALLSVGKTVKSDDKMGRFGRGLISPLDKCRMFRITSQLAGTNIINEWTFNANRIKAEHKRVPIPCEPVPQMPEIVQPFRTRARRLSTTWNTIVQLDAVTRDRTVRAIDMSELASQIQIKLGIGMALKKTVVHIFLNPEEGNEVVSRTVEPLVFTGQPLDIVTYDDADCGRVEFELFKAPRTREGRNGTIIVMRTDDKARVPWNEFRVQAMGAKYLMEFPEAFQVLSSGYFEGTIRAEKLDLQVDRAGFQVTDPLRALYMVIALWYEEHGKHLLETEQETRRDERYKKLGQQSLDRLREELALDPVLSSVLDNLVGNSPTPEPEPRDRKQHDGPAKPRQKRTKVEPSKPRERPQHDGTDRRPGQQHLSLNFAYEQRPTWDFLWEFDFETATVVFNTLHPNWVMVDESPTGKHTARQDRNVMHLQEWLGLEIVTLLSEFGEPEEFEESRSFIDKRVRNYIRILILR